MEKEKKYGTKKQITIVNSITATRFFGSFLIIPIFQILGGSAAAIFSAIFLLTDWIDGFLARKFKASTFFGALFDGACDKTFGIISFLILMSINPIVFSVPLLLEIGIILLQNKKLKKGQNIKSNMTGKIKTWFLSASIISSFLSIDLLNIPPIIDYIKCLSINKAESIKEALILMGLQVPTILMQILTITSYNNEIKLNKNDEKICDINDEKQKIIDVNKRLEEITIEKNALENKKTLLEQAKIMADAMFDPKYYDENKDMPIRDLKRELLKNGKNKK